MRRTASGLFNIACRPIQTNRLPKTSTAITNPMVPKFHKKPATTHAAVKPPSAPK
jgi:hypothetical protein